MCGIVACRPNDGAAEVWNSDLMGLWARSRPVTWSAVR